MALNFASLLFAGFAVFCPLFDLPVATLCVKFFSQIAAQSCLKISGKLLALP
ncbi:hypothetical protein [Campylobacter concisus]